MLGPGGVAGVLCWGRNRQTKETPSSLCCIFYVYQPNSESSDVSPVRKAKETMGRVENRLWLLSGMLSPGL